MSYLDSFVGNYPALRNFLSDLIGLACREVIPFSGPVIVGCNDLSTCCNRSSAVAVILFEYECYRIRNRNRSSLIVPVLDSFYLYALTFNEVIDCNDILAAGSLSFIAVYRVIFTYLIACAVCFFNVVEVILLQSAERNCPAIVLAYSYRAVAVQAFNVCSAGHKISICKTIFSPDIFSFLIDYLRLTCCLAVQLQCYIAVIRICYQRCICLCLISPLFLHYQHTRLFIGHIQVTDCCK